MQVEFPYDWFSVDPPLSAHTVGTCAVVSHMMYIHGVCPHMVGALYHMVGALYHVPKDFYVMGGHCVALCTHTL